MIQRNGNLAIDVTDQVHPEVRRQAEMAARVIGLDVAGIDIIADDISRPLEEQGGVVIEVNAGPGLQMHVEPESGTPRPVGDAIVATLFPEGEDGRIPIVSVAGNAQTSIAAKLIAHLLAQAGRDVGSGLGRRNVRRRCAYANGRLPRRRRCAARCCSIRWSKRLCSKLRSSASSTRAWGSTAATWPSSRRSATA